MPLTSAWHSVNSNVYHNNTQCTTGNNIESKYRKSGKGGKKLCAECAGLN